MYEIKQMFEFALLNSNIPQSIFLGTSSLKFRSVQ